MGGRRYGMYAKDWRRIPSPVYLETMVQRTLGMQGAPEVAPPPVVALSLRGFAHAVKTALRDLHEPLALRENPLLHSRLVAGVVESTASLEDRIVALQGVIREAAGGLGADRRGARVFRAIEETYLRGSPTQEVAAESLGLPFSTYRYQLTRAVTRVVDALWQREIGGPRSDK